MQDKTIAKTINKLIYVSLLTLIVCFIFIVSKYIGLFTLIGKIFFAFTPVFIAVFLSFIIEPFVGFFIKYGMKRRYSVLLVYVLLIFILALILYFTIPSLSKQVRVFVGNIPSLIDVLEKFLKNIGIRIENGQISNFFNSFLIKFSDKIVKYLSSSISIIFNVLLGVSGAIFLSFDFPEFRQNIKKYIPKRIKEPVIYYFQKFLPFVHKYFLGILIDTVIIFCISFIGFTFIDIEYILVVCLFIAVTNLIPIIGPYIGGVPAIIIGFSMSSDIGVSSIIIVLIVQIIESNFIQPLILKNIISLHPLEGILGISLFGALFGIVGMILSPVLIGAIKLFFLPYGDSYNNK